MDSADIPFGPPPSEAPIPLVVPDTTQEPIKPKIPFSRDRSAQRAAGSLCSGIKSNGDLCGWVHQRDSKFCYVHDPTVTEEERRHNRGKREPIINFKKTKLKSIEDILRLVCNRLDVFLAKWGNTCMPETESTFCDLVRTFVAVKKCGSTEEAADEFSSRFNLKRRQA